MTVNQLQAAYETIGVAASGQACIIEVKRSSDVIVAQQRIWLECISCRRQPTGIFCRRRNRPSTSKSWRCRDVPFRP